MVQLVNAFVAHASEIYAHASAHSQPLLCLRVGECTFFSLLQQYVEDAGVYIAFALDFPSRSRLEEMCVLQYLDLLRCTLHCRSVPEAIELPPRDSETVRSELHVLY